MATWTEDPVAPAPTESVRGGERSASVASPAGARTGWSEPAWAVDWPGSGGGSSAWPACSCSPAARPRERRAARWTFRPTRCAFAPAGNGGPTSSSGATASIRGRISHSRPVQGTRPMTSFPGYRLPDELLLLREQIRRFVRDELIPVEQRIDPDAPDIPEEDFRRLSAKTKAAGLWALGAPEEYGGGGLDTFSMCVLLEEMAQHRMGLYNTGCGVFGRYPPPAIWAGTKEQIVKYAVPAIREGWETFWAITEPSGGADPAGAIQTRAERRGDRWVLNGRKVFISRI